MTSVITAKRWAMNLVAGALVIGATLVSAPAARAQPAPAPVLVPVAPPPTSADLARQRAYGRHPGVALQLGGGFEDFTNQAMRDTTGTGGSWDLRLVFGMYSLIGFEAAYVGATREIMPLGRTSTSHLLSNGAEVALRLNAPIVRGPILIEPFGILGVGWAHYGIADYNTAFSADFTSKDDVLTVPVGGGIAFADGPFLLDVRASYTATYYNDMVRGGGGLDHWGAGGHIGIVF
jgi:hypothetical protein